MSVDAESMTELYCNLRQVDSQSEDELPSLNGIYASVGK